LDDDEDDDAIVAYVKHRTPEDLSGPSSNLAEMLQSLEQRRLRDSGRFGPTVIFTRFYDTLCDVINRLHCVAPGLLIGTYSGRGGQYWDGRAGRLQLVLDYVAGYGLLQSRQQTGVAEPLFRREMQALEGICQGRDSVRVRRLPAAFAQRLCGLLFDLNLAQVGEEAFIDAPQPPLQASLDVMYRVANGLKRKRAELSTLDVLARLTREIERRGR
jgi:hypothetical protein